MTLHAHEARGLMKDMYDHEPYRSVIEYTDNNIQKNAELFISNVVSITDYEVEEGFIIPYNKKMMVEKPEGCWPNYTSHIILSNLIKYYKYYDYVVTPVMLENTKDVISYITIEW